MNERTNKRCIYIALYCVLLYTQSTLQSCGGGSLLNHHQCLASTWWCDGCHRTTAPVRSPHEWISFWLNRVSQWFNGPFKWPHFCRFYWSSRFERIVWYEWFRKYFIKTGTYCHLLAVLLSYLLIHDRHKPAKVTAHKKQLSILTKIPLFQAPEVKKAYK